RMSTEMTTRISLAGGPASPGAGRPQMRARQGAGPPPFAGAQPSLVTSSAPPLRLPAEHLAAGFVLRVVGAAGLVRVAPDLAQGLFPLPRVVAVAHLFTLGWITMTVQGALYQFLPVALGAPIRSERVAHLSFLLYAPGLAAFLLGLALSVHTLLFAGAV